VKDIDKIAKLIDNEDWDFQTVHIFQEGINKALFPKPTFSKSPWGKIGCKKWHRFTYEDVGVINVQKCFNFGEIKQVKLLDSNK
jgi:hypothetical protein